MAEDPTLTQTLVNMIVSGCQMNAGVFTLMGKGMPQFAAADNSVLISLDDGMYTISVTYAGPPLAKAKDDDAAQE
jgi:hypothetical protein